MEFGQRLAARRKDKGLSMEALGKKLGENGKDVTKQTVWGWEDGRHFPKADQLAEICRRLECSSDFLLFGTEGALSPASTDLGRKLDAIANPQAREQAYQICYGAIQMAGNLPAPESHEVTQQVTRKAG